MEVSKGVGGGGDLHERDAFALVAGNARAFSKIHDSRSGEAMGVEEARGGESDGWVARNSEGFADRLAKEVAFRVDGVEGDGNAGIEGIENGARGDLEHVGLNGGQSRAERNFLEDWVGIVGRKVREGDGRGVGARTKDDGGDLGDAKSSVNGSVRELDHGNRWKETRE